MNYSIHLLSCYFIIIMSTESHYCDNGSARPYCSVYAHSFIYAFEDGTSGRFVEVFKASYPHFQDVGKRMKIKLFYLFCESLSSIHVHHRIRFVYQLFIEIRCV